MQLEKERIRNVFAEQYPGLCRFLAGIVGSSSAPDIAQESFLRLCSAQLGEVSDDEIRFWLFRVGRNLALNQTSREQTHKRLWRQVVHAVAPRRPLPDKELELSEARLKVRKLLARLPEHQRSALILREQEELSYKDIAIVLGVSVDKVRVDIFRGREKLRSLWKEDNYEL